MHIAYLIYKIIAYHVLGLFVRSASAHLGAHVHKHGDTAYLSLFGSIVRSEHGLHKSVKNAVELFGIVYLHVCVYPVGKVDILGGAALFEHLGACHAAVMEDKSLAVEISRLGI